MPTHTPIPGPPPRRFGPPAPMRRDVASYFQGLAREHGDVVQMRFGRFQLYLLSHPELARDILVTRSRLFMKGAGLQRAKRLLGEGLLTSEGEFHFKQRRLLQPVFLKSRIQNYAAAMGRRAEETAVRWRDQQPVDMAAEMARLTLAVVGDTLFSADVEGEAQQLGRALDTSINLFDSLNSPLAPLFEKLPFGPAKTFQGARDRLDETVFRLIAERRRHLESGGEDSGDLLSLLLGARYDDGSAMDDAQIRDEAMTIFLAGHETTANALAWTWYLLAQHPEVAAKVHAEALQVLGGHAPRHEHLEELVFTRQVIAESMRLYPPAWIVGRATLQDYEFEHGGHLYQIPRGATVAVSQWVMHRDPRFWEQPEEFRPERWQEPRPHADFAYIPFAAGPRKCIGEGFAWMEAILLFAGLAQHFGARLASQNPVRVQPRITLRPAGGISMVLHKR